MASLLGSRAHQTPRASRDGVNKDDSQGKNRLNDSRWRMRIMLLVVGIGAALGFVAAQLMYLWVQRSWGDYQPASVGAVEGGAIRFADRPRSELERLLWESAAPKEGRPPEVMIAISDYNLVATGALVTWIKTVKRAGVKNYMIVAIDKQLADYCAEQNVPVYYRNLQIDKVHEGTGANHAISALKYKIIREFLDLGWSVLLSDVDIVVVQDPFDHLYRDHDIEGMTDGFDARTAYGYIDGFDDPSMGWARYAQAIKHFNLNSGLFYIKANKRTLALMDRIATRLSKQRAWDQAVFNEEIFFLSHDDYVSANVSVRVMNIYKFMNSKILFKTVRHLPRASQTRPVMVHINYHPDKHERMLGVIKYYLEGDDDALKRYPGGSEPGT
eukprot:jgi/Botrbrau1/19635/Bobra.0003s0005.1